MARAKPPTDYIQAQCLLVILKGQAQFLRQDCAEPQPAYSKFIGVLPNGQCCYAVGATPDIIIAPTNAGYLIKLCEGVCDDDEF